MFVLTISSETEQVLCIIFHYIVNCSTLHAPHH